MGNYTDREATRPIELGPCRCPAQPSGHEKDAAVIRCKFGYGDLGTIRQAGRLGGPEAFNIATIVRGVLSWNLVMPDGKAREVDTLQANLLDEITVTKLMEELDGAFAEDPLPNAPGDPSPDGSPPDGTPTQTTPAPAPSTTS